jgi:hypothetical protein
MSCLKKELPENWDEGLIIVPVPDVERITKPEPLGLPTAPEDLREDNEADILEHFGEYVDQGVSPVVPSPEIVQVLGGNHGGSPLPYTDRSKMPPPDCHAFYLPFHYFYPSLWGVYLLYKGVLWLRDEIIRRSDNEVGSRQAFEAARLFLYYHGAFHHKTECFAIRLELAHHQAFYGFRSNSEET